VIKYICYYSKVITIEKIYKSQLFEKIMYSALGTVNLERFVSQPSELDESKKQEIEELIRQIEKNSFSNEQLPLKLLRIQREQYPVLDTSFLSMASSIELREGNLRAPVQVPRFSVYKKQEGNQFGSFSIRIHSSHHEFFNILFKAEIEDSLPEIFTKYLYKSLESEDVVVKGGINVYKISKRLYKRYYKLGVKSGTGYLNVQNEFCGILPEEIKRKIKDAEPNFDNLYLIAETKPEDWETPNVSRDALLVGVLKDKCYLITSFNSPSIESYVGR
jgi:hypothetical protein